MPYLSLWLSVHLPTEMKADLEGVYVCVSYPVSDEELQEAKFAIQPSMWL